MSRESRLRKWSLRLTFLALAWIYVLVIPYTKVEESFNLQAIRDILKLGLRFQDYDHQQFPGVVPRTFLAAIATSFLSFPAFFLATNVLLLTDLIGLFIVRMTIGFVAVLSFFELQAAVETEFGTRVSELFLMMTAMQFHLPFYISRTLPNTFALILTNFALVNWIKRTNPSRTLYILLFTMICFRCDVLLLVVGITGHLLLTRQLKLHWLLLHGVISVVGSVGITVLVDSWFWGRWLWPEGEVFYFNAILKKSTEWGTMPFHWYFTSALPRALLIAYPLSLIGPFLDRRTTRITLVSLLYVSLISKLGHKEVRFLFPTLPLLNISAASAVSRFVINRRKGILQYCCFLGLIVSGLVSILVTMVMLMASARNYPGGVALQRLHDLNDYSSFYATKGCLNSTKISVHIATLPAMTGVSRFGQLSEDCWSYSKEEGLSIEDLVVKNFSYLLTAESEAPGYNLVDQVVSFDGFDVKSSLHNGRLHMKLKPAVFILKRDILQT